MKNFVLMLMLVVACGLIICVHSIFGNEDYLTPPGAPGSEEARMKTLNQIEPRVAIYSLPYSITNAGSFYLTTSLAGVANSNGITILARDVKLDLNGFALNGVSNSRCGIIVPEIRDNISIRNGVIRGWGEFGILATNATDTMIEDVKTFGNSWGGLYVGANSMIERCAAYGNGYNAPPQDPPADDGIKAGSYSTIKDCKARNNKGAGIHAGSHCKITGCTATESGQADGIHAEDYCTIRDCTVARNKCAGITVFSKCRVIENTCGENGFNNTNVTGGAGIRVEGNSNRIEDNNVVGNKGGIFVRASDEGGNAYGNLIIRNSASGNGPDDYIMSTNVVGDYYGQVFGTNDMGASFSNSNPWSNFRF